MEYLFEQFLFFTFYLGPTIIFVGGLALILGIKGGRSPWVLGYGVACIFLLPISSIYVIDLCNNLPQSLSSACGTAFLAFAAICFVPQLVTGIISIFLFATFRFVNWLLSKPAPRLP